MNKKDAMIVLVAQAAEVRGDTPVLRHYIAQALERMVPGMEVCATGM